MFEIRKANIEDLNDIIGIIQQRIDWMDQMMLHQWNKTNYFSSYPQSYFANNISNFYVATKNGLIVGCIALYRHDTRWFEDIPAFYVHHLSSLPGLKGCGKQLLQYAENLARAQGVYAIRLDSQKDNGKLNDFYNALDYIAVDEVIDKTYVGIKRQKDLL